MPLETLRTTVVYVSLGSNTRVFRSAAAVPEGVRNSMAAVQEKGLSATVLIADRRGRAHLRRCASLRTRVRTSRIEWTELALLGAAGALLWLATFWR